MKLFDVRHTAKIGNYEFTTDALEFKDDPVQYWPARAVHNPAKVAKLDEPDSYAWRDWIAEEKLDGERLVLQFNGVSRGRATTRRVSKKTGLLNEKTNNVPHLRDLIQRAPNVLADCVLDGEVMYVGARDASGSLGNVQSIMNSKPERAVEIQKEKGWVQYVVFDLLVYHGTDLRDEPYGNRRVLLATLLERLRQVLPDAMEIIKMPDFSTFGSYKVFCEGIWARGGEGVVLKDMNATYGESQAWLKVKREQTYDAFVTGYEMGEGKYEGLIGTLICSAYDENGNVVEVAKVIPGTDEERKAYTENFSLIEGQVLELTAQEVTKYRRLRHPRIKRMRPDKAPEQCLMDQFIRDEG